MGIVGLNGSGKTTLVKLLTRIYDPTDGKITINGVDIKDIPSQYYTRHLGVVLQDYLLFAYSVRENIAFCEKGDEERILSSIRKSGLEDRINSLKYGINTTVYKELHDDGIEFSGGEGQKLALARALYKNSEIMVLDEPSSSLDPSGEYELFYMLSQISRNKTTILISHRLSFTRYCDRIVVLENSRIIENGSHEELLTQNGTYAELFKSQAKFYKNQEGVAI